MASTGNYSYQKRPDYIPGAPSYVRQYDKGDIFSQPSLPVEPLPSVGRDLGHGAPSYIKVSDYVSETTKVGDKIIIPDRGLPESLSNTDQASATGKETAKQIANTVKNDDNKQDPAPTPTGNEELKSATTKKQENEAKERDDAKRIGEVGGYTGEPYAPTGNDSNWAIGINSKVIDSPGESTKDTWPSTPTISNSMFSGHPERQTPSYQEVNLNPSKDATVPAATKRYRVYEAKYLTSWQNEGRRKEMLNQDKSQIQNEYNFPTYEGSRENGLAKYDYRFIPGSGPSKNIEDLLAKVRMQYGIQVHGNPNLERNVLYYMYNRFKSPDWGLAHSKSFTHVFFTRPDLYLMDNANQIASQLSKNSEMTMIYRRHPDLVKLLCDGKRMGDGNNFNFLLSNRCTSFPITNEGLSKLEVGQSWNEHKMVYGDGYTGRFAGELQCTFTETADYSIINLIKLWITYIDNVSRGAMTPFYGIPDKDGYGLNIPGQYCHVHDKALDYAASAYVFKVGPDGSDVLYWSKYYGIFPINTGAEALAWEAGPDQGAPKLNITFAYSYKLDLNPISLLEFNDNAGISEDTKPEWVPAFDPELPGSSRPFVGTPFIELIDQEPEITQGTNHIYDVDKREIESIKLRFKKDESEVRADELLFKANGPLTSSEKNNDPTATTKRKYGGNRNNAHRVSD